MTNPLLAPQIKSKLDSSSKTFAENKSEMLRKLEKIEELLDYVELGGGIHHHERLAARGKMAVRDRIANFIDPDSPFLEISALAAYDSAYPVGRGAYSWLKFESGVHRVQRVPETEAQGRIHTSACTVAIMPEADEINDVAIDTADLRVDTFRASGAGGQHVNRTDSAVRLTHLPSGIVVECQDERSQHKNKARAMSILRSRLLEAEQRKQHEAEAENRRNLVGSGDRSERIRTYNFPQGRVTDHRINLTLYKLDEILSGDLLQVVKPLGTEHQADLLAAMASE